MRDILSFATRERRALWALAIVGSAMTFAACSSPSQKLPGQSSGGTTGVGGSSAPTMVGGAAGTTGPAATGGSAGGLGAGTGGTPGTGGAAGGLGGGLGGGIPGPSVPPLGGTPTPESAGPMVMRRLTRREYSHILSDLLGDATDPGASFPLDEISNPPFEAPNSVFPLQVELYLSTADSVVATALANGNLLSPNNLPATCQAPAPADEPACAGQFIAAFGRRAFRRPVEADEVTDLQGLFTTARGLGLGFQEALAEVAKGMLQSPSFLYHWEIGATPPAVDPATGLISLTPWQVAARLAETLWESGPDDVLLSAAEGGELATPAQVGAQVSRMLADPRAARALEHFHEQLLIPGGSLADLRTLTKSSPRFAGVAASLPDEFDRFLTDVYLTGDGTLNTLLTAPYAFVDANLAPIYGVAVPVAPGFTKVALNPAERGGVLTQLAFLSATSSDVTDDPIRRGSVVYENLLCGTVPPEPPIVPVLPPIPPGPLTTRQIFTDATPGSCADCHALINTPGFAFENYDGLGVYRITDSGLPVDSRGTMVTPGQVSITFTNAIDLSRQLAASPEARWCLDRQWFRYMLGRPESAAEQGSLEVAYRSASATDGYSLRALLTAMVTSRAFLARAPSPGELP